jgi:hypothetical protein
MPDEMLLRRDAWSDAVRRGSGLAARLRALGRRGHRGTRRAGADRAHGHDLFGYRFRALLGLAMTDLEQFADRGHSLTVDSGWRGVAEHTLSWLAGQGLGR